MATYVFDFDSTLIDCESLDEILQSEEVSAITRAGMEGDLPFRESLTRRLAIATPTRVQVEAFPGVAHLTPGMDALIRSLDGEVWIVSGALREVVLPVAAHLSIPADRVLATVATWAPAGTLAGLECCGEKADFVRDLAPGWTRPRIAVGDGMSDYALLEASCVDRFIAFTAHVRRESVVRAAVEEARSVRELEYLLAP